LHLSVKLHINLILLAERKALFSPLFAKIAVHNLVKRYKLSLYKKKTVKNLLILFLMSAIMVSSLKPTFGKRPFDHTTVSNRWVIFLEKILGGSFYEENEKSSDCTSFSCSGAWRAVCAVGLQEEMQA
jgi:hypothetical protein